MDGGFVRFYTQQNLWITNLRLFFSFAARQVEIGIFIAYGILVGWSRGTEGCDLSYQKILCFC